MKYSIAEIELNYTPRRLKPGVKITHSEKAYEVFLDHWDKGTLELQEEFKILLLNNSHEPLGIYSLSKGTITGTLVDLKIMFAVILKSAATAIVCAHNHPSSRKKPSNPDIKLHHKIKKIANFHEINYLDNLIITPKGKYSFQDEGDF